MYTPLHQSYDSHSIAMEPTYGGGGGMGGSSRRGALGPNAEIGDMVQQLSKKNSKLQKLMTKMGTGADTSDFREELRKLRDEGKQLGTRILDSLKDATKHARTHESQEVIKKIKRQFEEQLEKFRYISQEIEQKEQQIVDSMASSAAGEAVHFDVETGRSSRVPSVAGAGYQQMQQQEDVQFSSNELDEIRRRAEGIRQIERDVNDISEMFTELKTLTEEQQETLDSIEDHTLHTRDYTAAASEELVKAEVYQKQSRKRMCCILFIVLGVVIALVLAGVFIFKK